MMPHRPSLLLQLQALPKLAVSQRAEQPLAAAADADAVAAAATAATAATAAQALAFVPLNGGPQVAYKKGDRLRLALTAVTSLGIGRTLIVTVPHLVRQSPGILP